MMGIAEAFLYTFRLYAAIIYTELPLRAADAGGDPTVHEKLVVVERNIDDRFKRLIAVVGSGYSSDVLMRSFLEWARLLIDTSVEVNEIVSDIKTLRTDYVNIGFDALTTFFNPSRNKDSKHFAADLDVKPVQVLPFGVDMPVVGLGTW